MPISRLWLEVHCALLWPAHLIARSAPFRNPTIAYLLPAYWQDVVSTFEVQSWFKSGWGNVYAIFFWASLWKFSVPIRKIHRDAYRDNLDIIFGLLSLIYWVLYYLSLCPYESLWISELFTFLFFLYHISIIYQLYKLYTVYDYICPSGIP